MSCHMVGCDIVIDYRIIAYLLPEIENRDKANMHA